MTLQIAGSHAVPLIPAGGPTLERRVVDHPVGQRRIDRVLTLYFVYYWALLYAVPFFGVTPAESRTVYLAFTLPTLLLPILGFRYAVAGATRPAGALLVVFVLVAGTISVARSDFDTARTAAALVLPLLVLVGARPRLRVRTINHLFLLSIVGSVLTTRIGVNVFGYLPDFSKSTIGGLPGWRISLFPFIPESAFFALVVFVLNLWEGKGRLRPILLAAALYFVVFSGIRSAMLCGVFAIAVFVIERRVGFRDLPFYRVAGMGLVAALLLAVTSTALVVWLASFENRWLNDVMFRGEDPRIANVDDALARVEVWRQHWRLFEQSPLIGIGTFDFAAVNSSPIRAVQHASGAEAGLTAWLARIGVTALLLPLVIYLLHLDALGRRNQVSYVIAAVLVSAMITYAVFLVPYNLMFLLMYSIACGLRADT